MKRRLSPLIISKYQVNLYTHHSGISSSGVNIKVETALMLDSTCYLRIKKEQRMLSLFRNTGPTSSLFEIYTLQLTEIYRYKITTTFSENTLQTFQSSFSINCKCWLNNTYVESMIAFSTNIQTLQNRYTMARFNKEKTHTFFFLFHHSIYNQSLKF